MTRVLPLLTMMGLIVCTSSTTLANDHWIVVEAREERGEASPLTARVQAALTQHGIEQLDDAVARNALDGTLDSIREAPEALRTQLSAASASALEEVARGHNARTREIATQALAQVGDLLPVLAREARPRRDIGDLCLYIVRAHLNERHPADARASVLECLRLIPNLQPAPDLHPPDVRDLVSDVQRDIGTDEMELSISTSPYSREDCPIFLNGTQIGQSPHVSLRVPQGRYYVHAECASRRNVRVHTVDHVAAQAGHHDADLITFHPLLDASLRLSPNVHLEYESGALTQERVILDAVALMGELGRHPLTSALLVVRGPVATALIRIYENYQPSGYYARVDMPELSTATEAMRASTPHEPLIVTVPNSASDDELARAIDHLLAGENVETTSNESSDSLSLPGLTFGIIGAVGLVTSWVSYGIYTGHQHKLDVAFPSDVDYATRLSNRDTWSTTVMVMGGVSSGFLTLAVPFLLPRHDGLPWWSYVAGVAGIGLATTGIILTAGDNRTLADDQMHFERTVPLGPLLAMHAVPLLAIPLTYACRALFHDEDGRTSASVAMDANALSLTVQGSF